MSEGGKPRMGRPRRADSTAIVKGVRLTAAEQAQLAYLAEQWECTESDAIRFAIDASWCQAKANTAKEK